MAHMTEMEINLQKADIYKADGKNTLKICIISLVNPLVMR